MVQPTQLQELAFISGEGTKLLGLDGLAVVRVEVDEDGARTVHVVTADETAAACPSCGVVSSARKGSATTRPRDVAYGPDPVRLVWQRAGGGAVNRAVFVGRSPSPCRRCRRGAG